MNNVLSEILRIKKKIIEEKKKILPVKKIQEKINFDKGKSIYESLKKNFGIIAELKRSSPSAGPINPDLDFVNTALLFEKCGVSGLSVLTCEPYFNGSIDDLRKVKNCVNIPVLMKDFIIDEYQLYEGKLVGADFIILIVRILSNNELKRLLKVSEELNFEILIEIHNQYDLKRVFKIVNEWENKILGINNRDLKTLKTDISNTINLIKFIPLDKIVVISESGIKEKSEIDILRESGIRGVLIGESILRSENLEEKLKTLMI